MNANIFDFVEVTCRYQVVTKKEDWLTLINGGN